MANINEIALSKLGLTELETKFMIAFVNGLYAEPHFSDQDMKDVAKDAGIPVKSAKGVLGSLVKKGIVWTEDSGTGYEIVYLIAEHFILHNEWFACEFETTPPAAVYEYQPEPVEAVADLIVEDVPAETKSFVATVRASGGTLAGGVPEVVSSRFESRSDAENWTAAMLDFVSDGAICETHIRPSGLRPEILASMPKPAAIAADPFSETQRDYFRRKFGREGEALNEDEARLRERREVYETKKELKIATLLLIDLLDGDEIGVDGGDLWGALVDEIDDADEVRDAAIEQAIKAGEIFKSGDGYTLRQSIVRDLFNV